MVKIIRTRKRKRSVVRPVLVAVLLMMVGYSLFRVWDTHNNYSKERQIREQMLAFNPTAQAVPVIDSIDGGEEAPTVVNQNILDAQQLNPDIVGWLSLDGTRIDYPFVQAADNNFYLRRDVNGQYSFAGTVFMDYRSKGDLSGFLSVIYGHNMENGTMFSDIERYDSADFFAKNRTGRLWLANATWDLEVVAYLTVQQIDQMIYDTGKRSVPDRQRFLTYIEENALRYRDLSLTVDDRLLVLSTCTNVSDETRTVIIARLTPPAP